MKSEKVLGFKEKDAEITHFSGAADFNVKAKWLIEMGKCFEIKEFVSLEWLEKWCKEQINKIGLKGKSKAAKAHNELVAVYVKDILSAAKKESEKK